jgi:diamine N-acetyltransferase
MQLRPATIADVPELAAVGRATFTDAFGHLYSPADLASFLAQWRSPERIAANIGDPATGVTVVEDGGEILAYCTTVYGKGFDERPDPKPVRPAYLAQLYCTQAATGRGIGAALMDDVVAEAQRRGCDAIQLSVFSGNQGAQRFYARYGFAKVADIHFQVGEQLDAEYLFEKQLREKSA